MYTLIFAPQAIEETVVKVDVLSAYGHYEDK